jgi:hypothetical protein
MRPPLSPIPGPRPSQARWRHRAWLAAVVLVTFCIQMALSVLVLMAPVCKTVPDWYKQPRASQALLRLRGSPATQQIVACG